MSMSVGAPEGDTAAMSEINTTPLVDVMLVLLIIFLVTIPVVTQMAPHVLPKASNIPTQTKPENITITVTSDGTMFWNGARVANRSALLDLIKAAAVVVPQPEIHIRGDVNARYEDVGKVIFTIQQGGVVKVGFLTEPDRGLRPVR